MTNTSTYYRAYVSVANWLECSTCNVRGSHCGALLYVALSYGAPLYGAQLYGHVHFLLWKEDNMKYSCIVTALAIHFM